VVLSNGSTDIVLPREYLEKVRREAEATTAFLRDFPVEATIAFRPNPTVCRYCANDQCTFMAGRLAATIVNEVKAMEGGNPSVKEEQ
jgi:hypothetical protein